MNKTLTVLLLAAILAIGSATILHTANFQTQDNTVVFAVTDTAANMKNIKSVEMTIDSLSVYNQSTGWTNVTSDPSQFPLLKLRTNNQNKLLTRTNLGKKNYSQVKINVADVTVTEKTGAQSKAVLPANEVTFNAEIRTQKAATSSVLLDIKTGKSLHTTQSNEYVFAPVVKLESRENAEVSVNRNNIVTISGGSLASSIIVGVDAQGRSRANFQFNSNSKMRISSDDSITVSANNNQPTKQQHGDGTNSVQATGSAETDIE